MINTPFNAQTREIEKTNQLIRSVYNWMAIGLFLTGFFAFYTANSPAMMKLIYGNKLVFFGLIIGELGLVFSLSARIYKIKAQTATMLFITYSILNGLTLAFIFLVYTNQSIASTFFASAGTFAAASAYGMFTKKDLTSMGSFLMMGLFGIIIASVINIFVQSSQFAMMISYIGVILFVGLTVYDTNELKKMAMTQPDNIDNATLRKASIIGALKLYLDFINLFLMLLRIMGDRR